MCLVELLPAFRAQEMDIHKDKALGSGIWDDHWCSELEVHMALQLIGYPHQSGHQATL
jgi:hypothetical protein